MDVDDVPIDADRARTWEDLLERALRDEGAAEAAVTTSDGFRSTHSSAKTESTSGGETTTPRTFLRKGARSARTSPLTPKTTPRVESARAKVGSRSGGGGAATTSRGTPGANGTPRETSGRTMKASPRGRGLFDDQDANVQPSTMEAWRAHKVRSASEVEAFEALELRARNGTRRDREAATSATTRTMRASDGVDGGAVVRDFISSPSAEEQKARAAFEQAKANLTQSERRFAEEKAAWRAQRDAAEEAFKAECDDVRRQFRREKAALMREMETRMAMPTKEERNESKFLREQLERNEEEFKAERKRAKLTVDRLRQQILDLTNEVSQLRMEKRAIEEKREVAERLREQATTTHTPPRCAEPAFESPGRSMVSLSPKPPVSESLMSIIPRALSVYDPTPSVSTAQSANAGATREREHDDGRVERSFADGRRVVTFPNGTCKEIVQRSPDEVMETVYFVNGDVKRTHPGGTIEYYYSDVETWHTTHPSGDELYHFVATDQVELHRARGSSSGVEKEILFPDGTLRRIHVDGREEDVDPSR